MHIIHLEAKNAEKMRTPSQLEPDPSDLLPCRTVLSHAGTSDANESLNAVEQAGCRSWYRSRVWKFAIVQPELAPRQHGVATNAMYTP